MPELPEVEVSRLGISPHLEGQQLLSVVARQRQLRWWIPDEVIALSNQPILAVSRRAKYLLIGLPAGEIILHLGMSGHLKVVSTNTPAAKHDHLDLLLSNNKILRLNDTRRFGAVLWQAKNQPHPLLAALGPEPLTRDFNAQTLIETCSKRSAAIKLVLMDNKVVVGVGNIYANEALFKAGISPTTPAKTVAADKLALLSTVVKETLAAAIVQGGTTLKDFSQADGKPGYFKQQLLVYGRGGQPCVQCQQPLSEIKLGQRTTVFCRLCQA
ncbi:MULTISPECIES: bifunctional DNA-formamidopyrimidine glycosylase/DNA-(apurinic or apyrimidinic site) lyase [unclassified Arsukibacterium]|uniref:bifunctional DNA-formamidopyrimidine glycosylase/DNA-(apurinic or apyrimidinic site) lyase n=1 Tax=unclassified Arsukibacterium TaxID=2635278 RepID=UPI000C3D4EA4|nr:MULTISPECIES: bifunctional DNA-formamidopyrimidine glycosylase/DNA-(apurinic or apyrimidinic site) lyase [unclassified Arsukibacterium]MBM34145.1 DNA-formamidopyrimidine glycosylase [Rheinheimera sp.]